MKGPHTEYLFRPSWKKRRKKRKKETHHSLVNLQSTATGLETMLLSLFSLSPNKCLFDCFRVKIDDTSFRKFFDNQT